MKEEMSFLIKMGITVTTRTTPKKKKYQTN